MKILHLVAGDLTGGAARGAYWLHSGLVELGIDSKILTNSANRYSDKRVYSTIKSNKDKAVQIARNQAENLIPSFYKNRKKIIFSTGLMGFDFTKTLEYANSDLIHLHWINSSFVNIKSLANVDKPIVWTMRDMWPMTGGCHYSMECEQFKLGCGRCPQLGSNKLNDLSRFILERKKKFIPKSLKLVGISHWLSLQAKESEIFRHHDIRTIHNNINIAEFYPIEKTVARKILGISTPKKIILTGSTNSKDFYKGFGKFLDALKHLNTQDYHICFFGGLDNSIAESIDFEYTNFGYLNDNISLRLIYSCADVFVAPSLMDAFGKTIVESMACGTPAVCFDATGPKDIITHKHDGYTATPFDAQSLADGIEWITNSSSYYDLCLNAINKATTNFDNKLIAKKYIDLYKETLDNA